MLIPGHHFGLIKINDYLNFIILFCVSHAYGMYAGILEIFQKYTPDNSTLSFVIY